ncbi:MAG: OmpA-OmpF porin, family [Gemmatimonadales bacterium]|nr:OmpA-OmpF porin, family [Gemmatimonadales bacterium]
MRVRGITLVLLLTTASVASAQSAGTFEITGFGRFTRFDDTIRIQEELGGGGSLGFYLLPMLALEAEGAYTRTHSNVTGLPVSNIPLRGRLSLHIPTGGYASGIRIGAGYVRNLYRKSVNFDDNGFTGIFGFRFGLSPSYGFRIDGTADYVRSPEGGRADHYINWGAQAGLSLMLGRSSGGVKDKDQDGIVNKFDTCANTPVGKAVDAAGCATSQKDGDHDRVNDEADRCPGTATGETVDADGCAAGQRDADRDGVADPADRCPGTLAGKQVDSTGCIPEPPDQDKDGVLDAADQCPGSPAGDQVSPTGCPVRRDSDADRVHDGLDLCPNTPKGETVNENGCTIIFQKQARNVILRGVTFQTGSATLTPEARDVLRDIAGQLVENPQYRVQISGHTDNTGRRATNLRLSIARARAVETFLEANGVPRAQVTSKGFGSAVPIAPNATVSGRAQNRRVELHRTN